MVRLALIAVLALVAAGAALAGSDGRPDGGARASESPPDAPVIRCRDRIEGAFTEVDGKRRPYRFRFRPRYDTIIGPIAFSGARGYGAPGEWERLAAENGWLKSPAILRRRARVTLEVPREQRSWLKLAYEHGAATSDHAVTMRACRRRVTAFSGGFEVDWDTAPRQGRCAELIVWAKGQPRRERLYPEACG